MPLQKALVPVDIVSGLDTKTDEKLTAKLTDLQNGRYTVGSQISKRLGYSSLSQDIAGTTSTLAAGDGVASFQDELLAFSSSKLYSYSSGLSKWVDRGQFLSVKCNSTEIVRNTSEVRNPDSCIASGLILYAWEQYSAAGVLEGVYASVLDATSGALMQTNTLLDATAINPRCIAIGSKPTMTYVDTSTSPYTLKIIQVDITDPTVFTTATVAVSNVNTSNPWVDVAVFNGDLSTGSAVYAYNTSGATTIGIGYINVDGEPGTPANGYPAVTTFASTDASSGLAVTVDRVNTSAATQGRIYVAYASTAGSQGLKLGRYTSILTHEATHTVEGTSTLVDGIALLIPSGGDLRIVYGLNASNTYDHILKTAVYDIGDDTMGSASVLKRSLGLASKMFEYSGTVYMVGVHDSDLQPTYFALDTEGLLVAKLLPGTAGGLPSKAPLLSSIQETSTGVFEFGGLVKTKLLSKNNDLRSLAGVARMELDYTSVERFESSEQGENLHVGGGFLSIYDSQDIVEASYHIYPENVSASVNNGAGSMAAGTYVYRVLYTWTDARGQTHRSAPSVGLSATTSGGSSTVTLTIPSLRLTQKGGVIVEVYRTIDGGSIYYKIGSVANSTSADSVTLADAGAISDANLVAKESLYTNGGILENIAPPASLVLAPFKNRMFCVSSENPKKLFYSKKRVSKKPVEFSDDFVITLNKAQRVTALAELDQKLIIFEPNQIFYVTGNGPTATGAQDDFSEPNLITGDVGCSNTNSIVLMPLGLMFATTKGIYLLNRSLETLYIGADVESYNSLTITSAELIETENQIRYLTSDGRCLVYDYYFGKWSTWTNHSGVGATTWRANGDYVYMRDDGRIFQQSATSYLDGNDPVELSLTTSWVKTNGVQGLQRVRRALVLGDFKSDHKIMLEVGVDYKPYFSETHTWDYNDALGVTDYGEESPYGSEVYGSGTEGLSDGVYQFRAHIKNQKCESMRFRISDIEEATPGQAYSISSLMLEVGVKSTSMKLPQQKLI